MVNVRTVVTDAYRMIGDIGDADALDGTRTVVGLQLLNELCSSLNLENFFAFSTTTVDYIPGASQQIYTIGDGADIDAGRPSSIMRAYYSYQPLAVKTEIQQVAPQDIYRFQSAVNTTGVPVWFAYESAYPWGKIVLSTKMMAGGGLTIVYSKALPVFTINDIAEVPPEYEPTLKYTLAHLLAERYGKPQEVIAGMQRLSTIAKDNIRRNTMTKSPLIHELANGPASAWNIYAYGSTTSGWGGF